ncbi:MAG: RidA family protein [Candidatus Hydrothermae bacterium]|nr:RidA family protein [Candidatus Hydrothermae bacterium]
MPVKRISSGSAYEPRIGYCRAVVANGWVHVSGTVGNDHATMTTPESVVEQCELALGHIQKALKQAGASFADVVRVHYILPDRDDFEPCWPLLQAAFGENPPAATMIEAGLIDPAMKIEIEVTARLPQSA